MSSNLHGVDSDGECRVVPVFLRFFAAVLVLSGPLLMCGVDPVHADHHNHHQGGDTNHDNDCGCWRRCSWRRREYRIVSYRTQLRFLTVCVHLLVWDKYLHDKHFFICVWLINKLDANNNSSLYNPRLIFIVLTNILFIYVKISLLRLMSLL